MPILHWTLIIKESRLQPIAIPKSIYFYHHPTQTQEGSKACVFGLVEAAAPINGTIGWIIEADCVYKHMVLFFSWTHGLKAELVSLFLLSVLFSTVNPPSVLNWVHSPEDAVDLFATCLCQSEFIFGGVNQSVFRHIYGFRSSNVCIWFIYQENDEKRWDSIIKGQGFTLHWYSYQS